MLSTLTPTDPKGQVDELVGATVERVVYQITEFYGGGAQFDTSLAAHRHAAAGLVARVDGGRLVETVTIDKRAMFVYADPRQGGTEVMIGRSTLGVDQARGILARAEGELAHVDDGALTTALGVTYDPGTLDDDTVLLRLRLTEPGTPEHAGIAAEVTARNLWQRAVFIGAAEPSTRLLASLPDQSRVRHDGRTFTKIMGSWLMTEPGLGGTDMGDEQMFNMIGVDWSSWTLTTGSGVES